MFRRLHSSTVAAKGKYISRPPIITIMGHVDHGKTTLLDFLRKSSVVSGEKGGITQHIGAFSLRLGDIQQRLGITNATNRNSLITFLDTPGHAAFRSIRERGANLTDIIVLVISVEDGVMAQTEESIAIAKRFGVPIIVAFNKCDRFGTEMIPKIKERLMVLDVVLEDFGGDSQSCIISGKTGKGLDCLLESILAEGEVQELSSSPTSPFKGVILESSKIMGLGAQSTIVVLNGSLRKGQILLCDDGSICRVRTLKDHAGNTITDPLLLGPSQPVQVTGWKSKEPPKAGSNVIESGDKKCFDAFDDDNAVDDYDHNYDNISTIANSDDLNDLKKIANDNMWSLINSKTSRRTSGSRGTLDSYPTTNPKVRANSLNFEDFIPSHLKDKRPSLPLIIKSDVQGSLDGIRLMLNEISQKKVKLVLLTIGIGPPNSDDIHRAHLFGAKIVLFNQKINKDLYKMAEGEGVEMVEDGIIYSLIERIKEWMINTLPKKKEEIPHGKGVVKEIFQLNNKDCVAGSCVTSGKLFKKKGILYRIIRDDVEIWKGSLESMRHLKSEVIEVKSGMECGLIFDPKSLPNTPTLPLLKGGDVIECLEERWVKDLSL